jgi:enoyl-CoA hydratase/carnithine racemase
MTTAAPAASENGVRLTVADGIGIVTIDRPASRNAISRGVMSALNDVLDRIEAAIEAGELNVAALRGGGDRVFISGGDLKELATIRTEPDATAMSQTMRGVLDRIATLPVPTVALLNGDAYGGGGEVAVACDLRLASADIKIAFNQVALGIMPAWGGIERLTSLVGRGRALQLLLTGTALTAEAADAINLIEFVVPRERFEAEAAGLLAALAAIPATPARAIKSLVASVTPASFPDLAALASAEFARSWVADDHWAALAAAQARRAGQKRARDDARAHEPVPVRPADGGAADEETSRA